MVTGILPGRDALRCALGFLAEKYIADVHGGNNLDLANLVLTQPDVGLMYQDASHPYAPDEKSNVMFQVVKNAWGRGCWGDRPLLG